MGMSMHDRYYQPDDDGYPDDWDAKVEEYTFELLAAEYNMHDAHNWAEGLSECGYDESDYPTPSHAPVEVIDKVSVYWYDIAYARAKEHYEENSYND